MSLRRISSLLGVLVLAACESGTGPDSTAPAPLTTNAAESKNASWPATASVFATGFQFPRGLTFGPDGALSVAEAGAGGTETTTGKCTQVIPPVGPYRSGPTARISRIDRRGIPTTVATGFPSSANAFQDYLGVADVTFIGDKLFALVAGGGCSHGSATVPAGVARVSKSGAWSIIADLSEWQASHPVKNPNAADFEPDGSWYSMISSGGSLVAVEPNHGEVVRVNPHTGKVTRIVDLSATYGHIVPTVIAERRGAFYLSSLGLFPGTPGSQKILRISKWGAVSEVASGFKCMLSN